MTDAEFDLQCGRLRTLADKWVTPLGLGWYSLDFAYARDNYKPPTPLPKGMVTEESLAYCSTDWRYASACITWNMPTVAEQDDDHLERAFVHELMHIFLHEMRWTADNSEDSLDHEERVASTLAKAFIWLREALTEGEEVDTSTPVEIEQGHG